MFKIYLKEKFKNGMNSKNCLLSKSCYKKFKSMFFSSISIYSSSKFSKIDP